MFNFLMQFTNSGKISAAIAKLIATGKQVWLQV